MALLCRGRNPNKIARCIPWFVGSEKKKRKTGNRVILDSTFFWYLWYHETCYINRETLVLKLVFLFCDWMKNGGESWGTNAKRSCFPFWSITCIPLQLLWFFFLVNAPRSFGMPDPCKNCRVQHSCRVLLTCKKEFLSIKTSCSVWSQGGVENGERIRFSEPYKFGFRAAFFFFFFLFPVSHHELPHRTKRDPI